MNKLSIVFLLAVMAITLGNVKAMGQPYYGQQHPNYGQQFPQQHHGQSCSRQMLEHHRQKNVQDCQEEMARCHYGDSHSCEKAQNDCQDVQKYAYLIQQCPYP